MAKKAISPPQKRAELHNVSFLRKLWLFCTFFGNVAVSLGSWWSAGRAAQVASQIRLSIHI